MIFLSLYTNALSDVLSIKTFKFSSFSIFSNVDVNFEHFYENNNNL